MNCWNAKFLLLCVIDYDMALKPEIGKRYNQLEIISEEIRTNKSGRLFEVRCDCGKVEFKIAKHIVTGRCKSCKSCASKRTAKKYPPPINSQYIGSLGKTYFSSLANGAKRRGLEFSITQQYAWSIFENQGGVCKLSGLPITLSVKTKKCNPDYTAFTASLDRIDSNKGYVEGNVQWVHKAINKLKNNLNEVDFIEMCTQVANYQRYANQQPSTSGMM